MFEKLFSEDMDFNIQLSIVGNACRLQKGKLNVVMAPFVDIVI